MWRNIWIRRRRRSEKQQKRWIGEFTSFFSDDRIYTSYRPTSLKSGFKKPGKDGSNIFRSVLVTEPPGIGKTTSDHLCAKLAGFTPIEMNASDARSKKLVEVSWFYVLKWSSTETDVVKNGMNINNTSLDGYVKGNVVSLILTVFILPRSLNARTQTLSELPLADVSYNGWGGRDVCWRLRWCRRFECPNQKVKGSIIFFVNFRVTT